MEKESSKSNEYKENNILDEHQDLEEFDTKLDELKESIKKLKKIKKKREKYEKLEKEKEHILRKMEKKDSDTRHKHNHNHR